MKTSDSLTDLLPALCAARATFPAIVKNQTAQVRSEKGNYSFDYADLGAILDAVSPALTANGLLLTFGLEEPSEGRVEVSARLWHCASAQYVENALSAPKPTSLTATGSLVTYLKRYTSTALLGVCAEDDDDASAAEGNSITMAANVPASATHTNGHHAPPQAGESPERPTEGHLATLRNLAGRGVQVDIVAGAVAPEHAAGLVQGPNELGPLHTASSFTCASAGTSSNTSRR
jgi:hypothetical protein